MNTTKSNNTVSFLVKVLLIFVFVTGTLLFTMKFCISRSRVDGMSMYPTLWDGEHVFVNKLVYRNNDPERFDIVIFATPISETGYFIKRVIGLPGETVQIDTDGNIYVDDNIIDDEFGFGKIEDPGRAINPVTLGENEYFCLGDNRNHSEDSRFSVVGNISKDKILGRVRIRLLPLEKYGFIDLYMERTNK